MTDERLKIWIELGKWAVVSVGLVIMTKIIDTGFKDREVGINEIKEYDKYVGMVTDNTKISERRLLAQYFAYVTPSETLKEGWASYFEVVDQEYQELLNKKEQKQEKLSTMIVSSDSLATDSRVILQLEEEIKSLDNELTPTFKKANANNSNAASALNWEKVGFENLIDRNLNEAISAFENAENSYNSFHQVFEIAQFLKEKRDSPLLQDDSFWQMIYQEILSNYSWRMPKVFKTKMNELID